MKLINYSGIDITKLNDIKSFLLSDIQWSPTPLLTNKHQKRDIILNDLCHTSNMILLQQSSQTVSLNSVHSKLHIDTRANKCSQPWNREKIYCPVLSLLVIISLLCREIWRKNKKLGKNNSNLRETDIFIRQPLA